MHPPSAELRQRIASSIALAIVATGTAWWGGWPFAILWIAAGIAIAVEWIEMSGLNPGPKLKTAASTGLVALGAAQLVGVSAAFMAGIALATVATLGLLSSQFRDRVWSVTGFTYAAAIVLVPVLLRDRPGLGLVAIGWMFAVVWTTDIVAYFTGRALGGPKLWPSVSPKKTWSGFGGGLLGGTIAGSLIAALSGREGGAMSGGLLAVVALSAIGSVVSQAGDLAESAMKRHFGVKDSGWLIPGHGGVMDRLDGFSAVTLLVGLALIGEALAGRNPMP